MICLKRRKLLFFYSHDKARRIQNSQPHSNIELCGISRYYCESWIFTEALIDKLDIIAITCYRIILGIYHSRGRVTNESLSLLTKSSRQDDQRTPALVQGYCIRMTTDKISSSLRPGAPRTTYLNQISS